MPSNLSTESARANFEAWYAAILESLYPTRNAGFAIAMITFPLLERYVRQKVRLSGDTLTDEFYDCVLKLLPQFKSRQNVRLFWKAYRHGLLHQATLQRADAGDVSVNGALTHDITEELVFSADGQQTVLHPVLFARRVVEIIRGDFDTFFGDRAFGPAFPEVRPMKIYARPAQHDAAVSTAPLYVKGTGTDNDR